MCAKIEIAAIKVIDVGRRNGAGIAKPGVDVVTHAHKVNAGQQGVIHRTGREFALQLGIDREILEFFVINHVLTGQRMAPL
ncbi:hypothetical protein D3C80_1105670 [compost metagenome]